MTGCAADHPESGSRQHGHPGAADERGHGVPARSDSRYVAIALGLIVCFLVFEVVMTFAGRSLALLADAGHTLTDAGALGAGSQPGFRGHSTSAVGVPDVPVDVRGGAIPFVPSA